MFFHSRTTQGRCASSRRTCLFTCATQNLHIQTRHISCKHDKLEPEKPAPRDTSQKQSYMTNNIFFPFMDDARPLCWLSPTMSLYLCETQTHTHTSTEMAEAMAALVKRTTHKTRIEDTTRQHKTGHHKRGKNKTGQRRTRQCRESRQIVTFRMHQMMDCNVQSSGVFSF